MGEQTGSWAILRQVVVATSDHAADVLSIQKAFGLGEAFTDPMLESHALDDATFPVAATGKRYLEIVGPNEPDTAVSKWLAKVSEGRGGFVLSVQVPDAAAVKERALASNVRVPIDTEAFGKPVLQLHPKDVGMVLEIDEIPDTSAWFWDDIDPGADAGAGVSEIVGVEVPVADPAAMTELWRHLLDIPAPGTANELDLGGTWVRFTPGGPSANWTVHLQRTDGNDSAVDPELAGISFQLV